MGKGTGTDRGTYPRSGQLHALHQGIHRKSNRRDIAPQIPGTVITRLYLPQVQGRQRGGEVQGREMRP